MTATVSPAVVILTRTCSSSQRTTSVSPPPRATEVGPQPARDHTGVLVWPSHRDDPVIAHLGIIDDIAGDYRPFWISRLRIDHDPVVGGRHRDRTGDQKDDGGEDRSGPFA